MHTHFDHMLITRERFDGLLANRSFEELVKIPDSHNNNMLWNYGHTLVTQQLLSFGLCKLELSVPMDIVNRYRKGSSPKENKLLVEDLEYFRKNQHKLVEDTRRAYDSGEFAHFNEYTTSYGINLHSIEEAIAFNSIHEGLHLGYAMALRKLV